VCLRLTSTVAYDQEAIWARVQPLGGHLEFRGDCIDFFVPERYLAWIHLQYPELTRQQHLDFC